MKADRNKQLLLLDGVPLIIRTLRVFEQDEWCKGVIVVGNPNELTALDRLFTEYELSKIIDIVPGGKERQNSVYEGLKALEDEALVLIHDGARPFVPIELIHALVVEAAKSGSAVLAVPIKDTVKQIHNQQVVKTVDRNSLWAVQTPQAFHLPIILKAHEEADNAGFIGTDDASLIEKSGGQVSIVEGSYLNIKLTTPEDMLFANAIIHEKARQSGDV